MDLDIRKTRKYCGSCKHLDEWMNVGSMKIAFKSKWRRSDEDHEDPCDPMTQELFLKIEANEGVTLDQIDQAISDHFTSHGCACAHDCCGCRSYRAHDIQELGKGYWHLFISSSRNF